MNITRKRKNGRKRPREDCSQRVLVEPEGYVRVPTHGKITRKQRQQHRDRSRKSNGTNSKPKQPP